MAEQILQSQYGGPNMFAQAAKDTSDALAGSKSFMANILKKYMPQRVAPAKTVGADGKPLYGAMPAGVVQSADNMVTAPSIETPTLFKTPKKVSAMAAAAAPAAKTVEFNDLFKSVIDNGAANIIGAGGQSPVDIGMKSSPLPTDVVMNNAAGTPVSDPLQAAQVNYLNKRSAMEQQALDASKKTGLERGLGYASQLANIAAPIASYILGSEQNKMQKDFQEWQKGRTAASDRRKSEFARRAGGSYNV